MKWRTAYLLLLCALFGFGCSQPSIRQVTSSTRVLAFGDSLTAGYGVSRENSYPVILAELLGCEVINSGISGQDTDQGLQRLSDELYRHAPDLVVVCYGGNDMLRKQSSEHIQSNLRQMIELIRGTGAEVVMVGVPKPGLFLRVPDFYANLAKEYQIPLEGDVLETILSKNNLKSDQIHPNEKGYRLMAESIYTLIQQAGQ